MTTDNQTSDRCELCNNTRQVGVWFGRAPPPECPWCKAVRYKYGSYFYPIDDSNKHLFKNKPPAELPLAEARVREIVREELENCYTLSSKGCVGRICHKP
jgi:hypothetical protein